MMRTADGTDIRRTDPYRHKYGSAMAEYIDTCRGGWPDDYASDGMGGGWVARHGRRLLSSDSQGFVDVERFDSIDAAAAAYAIDAAQYDNPEEDPW